MNDELQGGNPNLELRTKKKMDKLLATTCCIIIILCSSACESKKPVPQKPEGTAAAGRFVPTGSDATVALDTQTGRLCRTTSALDSHADLPECGDVKVEYVEDAEPAKADDPTSWQNTDIAVAPATIKPGSTHRMTK